jgi:hypothetical protein
MLKLLYILFINNSVQEKELLNRSIEKILHITFQKKNLSSNILFETEILLTRNIGTSTIRKLAK